MDIRLAKGGLPRVSHTGQSHRTQWGRYRQLRAFPSVQGEFTVSTVPCLSGYSLPRSSMVTWALSRSNGVDNRYMYTTHIGNLMGDLVHCSGPIRSSFIEDLLAPWLGVLSLKVSAVISLGMPQQ